MKDRRDRMSYAAPNSLTISRMMQSLILLMACIGSGGLNGYSQELENTDRSDTAAGGEPQIKIDEKRKISYSQEIQPLLRRHCVRCHGGKQQEADLRLDRLSTHLTQSVDPTTTIKANAIVVAGNSEASGLIQRISDPEEGDLMPLDSDPLSEKDVELIRRWIDQGAAVDQREPTNTAKHWAYQPIQKPSIPTLGQSTKQSQSASPIDPFILRKLTSLGLSFSEQESPQRLLRRVSLALTGIPPTPKAVDTFAKDPSLESYERLVDQYLDSPRYGERWAVYWLDLARYADSNGFQADQIRDNWAYRDWVIKAFNDAMPYDQFIHDQIAGDLKPNPTIDQQIATGFHRMTTCNVEAGVDPEANRVNQVVDRVNTTATVFLGTTLECAQCHDHKYDPFTQKEYYQLFAYFNNTAIEVKNTSGVTWDFYGPMMDLPMSESKSNRLATLKTELKIAENRVTNYRKANTQNFNKWIAELAGAKNPVWLNVVPEQFETTGKEDFHIDADGSVLLSGQIPDKVEYTFTFELPKEPLTAVRIEALIDEKIPGLGPGRGDPERTNIILNEIELHLCSDTETQSITLTDPQADFSQTNWHVSKAIDGDPKTGWAIAPQFGKSHWASFTLSEPLEAGEKKQRLQITLKQFYGGGRVIGKPRISFNHGNPMLLSIQPDLIEIAKNANRSAKENKQLRVAYDAQDAALKTLKEKITQIKNQITKLKPDTTLVMQEDSPRETFVMRRGDYESPTEQVNAATPKVLTVGKPTVKAGNRLDLAHWLTSRENPLTARVTVNQWWSEIFGRGLVSTPEDFGSQGEYPSHPELLDWLASELIESGWSMKHLHKLMVMSFAFRQSNAQLADSAQQDPQNRWLSRGPRFRMKAELIRDNALAISGLLSTKQGGPPVMPYQPDNLWRSVGRNQPKWIASTSEDRFRRGVYVVWKRAAPYPSFVNFDAPNRGSCTIQRSRSNTPLQALTLLNDPAFVEMALGFADRILSESPSTDEVSRLHYAAKLALSRMLTNQEIKILTDLLKRERALLRSEPGLAETRVKGPSQVVQLRSNNLEELASWMSVTNALLNLDETMSR